MRIIAFITAVLAVLAVTVPALAQTTAASTSIINTEPSLKEKFYLGGGFQLDIPSFKTYDETIEGEDVDVNDFDNTWGLQLKAGYFVNDYLAIEGLFQYHRNFEWKSDEYSDPVLGTVSGKIEVSGFSLSVNAKGFLPLGQFRPYAVAGLGYARGKAKGTGTYDPPVGPTVSYSESETDSGPMGRIGIGCDVLFNDSFGLEGEVAYNIGMSDIDYVRFVALSAGVLIVI